MTIEAKEYQAYMSALAGYCRDKCFMGEYLQTIRFKDKPRKDDSKDTFGSTMMDVSIDEVYLQMLITVYPTAKAYYDKKDYKTCGKTMLHEICHGFVKPISNMWDWDDSPSQRLEHQNIIERQTQRIANTIFALLPTGWYLPSKLLRK